MKGGKIEIKGDARNFIGSAYRGNWKGMKGGEIIIHGNAGDNIGTCILGGRISIKGNTGQFLGFRMKGGEIIVEGNVGTRVGAEMEAGKITIHGKIEEILPSFKKKGKTSNISLGSPSPILYSLSRISRISANNPISLSYRPRPSSSDQFSTSSSRFIIQRFRYCRSPRV